MLMIKRRYKDYDITITDIFRFLFRECETLGRNMCYLLILFLIFVYINI